MNSSLKKNIPEVDKSESISSEETKPTKIKISELEPNEAFYVSPYSVLFKTEQLKPSGNGNFTLSEGNMGITVNENDTVLVQR